MEAAQLKGRIGKITAGLGGQPSKLVSIDWFVTVDSEQGDQEIVLLQDQIGVEPQATDEEILAAVRSRKLVVAPSLKYEVPNPETNKKLSGEEV